MLKAILNPWGGGNCVNELLFDHWWELLALRLVLLSMYFPLSYIWTENTQRTLICRNDTYMWVEYIVFPKVWKIQM